MATLKVKGDSDGLWDLRLKRKASYDKDALVEATKVDFDLRSGGELMVKAYYPKRVVDCDHWQLRTLDVRIEGVTNVSMNSGQLLTGHGYLNTLSAFKDSEEPEIEWPEEGDPLCCSKPHGSVDTCFPPTIFETDPEDPTMIPVTFELTLRRKK